MYKSIIKYSNLAQNHSNQETRYQATKKDNSRYLSTSVTFKDTPV
jgi:hypothetical protein